MYTSTFCLQRIQYSIQEDVKIGMGAQQCSFENFVLYRRKLELDYAKKQ